MPGTLIATELGLTGISYYATAFAVNYAVSQVVTRTFGEQPGAFNQQDSGSRQQVPPSSENTIPVVYGDAYLGGTFVDAVLTNDQKTMYYVLAISSISDNGEFDFDTTKMYFGDRLITFKSTGNTAAVASLTDEAGNVDTAVASGDLLQIYLYTSDASGAITPINTSSMPSTVMGGSDIASTYRWPSTGRQMNGLAFAIVKLGYSREASTTQMQPVTFHVSHYLNGQTVARPGDAWYDYMTNTVYGGAVDPAYIDTATVTALNTYSDQTITFSGGSQPRYRLNGVLNTGDTVLSNIDKLLTACDSWMAYNAASGQWSIVINKAESISYYFDDTNIIGEIRVSATDITSSINQIEAKFPFADNRDQAAYVNMQTPSGLLYPNEPVNKYTMSIDMTNNSIQAQYIANRVLEQAREDLIVSFSTTYYGIQVDAGQVIALTNADYGWTDKPFRVMRVNEASMPDGSLGARLELSEYNSQVYDDKSISEYTPAPNSGLAAPSYFSSLSSPSVTASRPTANIPSFDVRVTIPTTGRVTFINLFYTTSSSPSASDWTALSAIQNPSSQPFTNATNFDFLNNVLPVGTYYFGFVVGNDISQSPISPLSSSFSWSPDGTATQIALVSLYQWAASTPANPTGNSTYTWATATNSAYTASDGWDVTIPANPGTSNIKLWSATKSITNPTAAATTTINWTTGASIAAISQNGTNGSSARQAFARVAGNPTPVSGSIATSGGSSYPSSAQSLSTWGFSATWGASDPNPSSTSSLYQSDGIYDPSSNTTTWTTPYISYLKVAQLSAITADMGILTSGEIIVGSSPTISGSTMTGSGTHLYSDGRFALGNSTANIVFDGTNANINGFVQQSTSSTTSTAINIGSTPPTILTFTSTKNNANLIGFTGSVVLSVASSAISLTPNQIAYDLYFYLYTASNTFIQQFYVGYRVPVVPTGSFYTNIFPFNLFIVKTLPADSYKLLMGNTQYPLYYNSSGTAAYATSTSTHYIQGFTSQYQATV